MIWWPPIPTSHVAAFWCLPLYDGNMYDKVAQAGFWWSSTVYACTMEAPCLDLVRCWICLCSDSLRTKETLDAMIAEEDSFGSTETHFLSRYHSWDWRTCACCNRRFVLANRIWNYGSWSSRWKHDLSTNILGSLCAGAWLANADDPTSVAYLYTARWTAVQRNVTECGYMFTWDLWVFSWFHFWYVTFEVSWFMLTVQNGASRHAWKLLGANPWSCINMLCLYAGMRLKHMASWFHLYLLS